MILTIDQIALAILLQMNIHWGNPIEDASLLCISHAVYQEAASEHISGKLAVANVINNRKQSKRFPDTYCEVVKQPYAFSYTLIRKRHAIIVQNDLDIVAWQDSVLVALAVVSESVNDTTNGSDHYLNKMLVAKLPSWYTGDSIDIGEHSFIKIGD